MSKKYPMPVREDELILKWIRENKGKQFSTQRLDDLCNELDYYLTKVESDAHSNSQINHDLLNDCKLEMSKQTLVYGKLEPLNNQLKQTHINLRISEAKVESLTTKISVLADQERIIRSYLENFSEFIHPSPQEEVDEDLNDLIGKIVNSFEEVL
jgi:hypothetical protein